MDTKICDIEISRSMFEAVKQAIDTPVSCWGGYWDRDEIEENQMIWDGSAEFDNGFVLDLNVYAPSDFEDDDATAWGDLVLFERDPSGKFLNEVSCDVHHDFKEGPILFEHAGIIYQINLRVVNDAPSED